MEHTLDKILGKPSDYKVCSNCKRLNWYENETCIECSTNDFKSDRDLVLKLIDDEYKFYKEEEGYDIEEIDKIEVQV